MMIAIRAAARLLPAMISIGLGASGLAHAAPADASDLRDFCPDRPGLGSPACTIDKGHADAELGLADWSLDRESGTRTDDFVFGDLLLRYGLTDSLEAQIHWTGLGIERVRGPGGAVGRRTGIGDTSLALRQNLVHPDGSGFSAAIMPVVTLPTGTGPLRSGTWGASLLVPVSWQLPHGLQLDFTGEVDAAPDQDGSGRHLAYGGVAGLDIGLGGDVTGTLELAASRGQAPAGASDQ